MAARRIEADVVIVGGRPAGASLAARLGARGRRVVILDKARHPSRPAVPSCPILYAPAMRLLDELGVAERDYADESARVAGFGVTFEGAFSTVIPVAPALGRDYAMGVDRASFDALLWRHLDAFPSVDRREATTFVGVLRDEGGAVCGVRAEDADGPLELRAALTVGADGRFSPFASAVGAGFVESHDAHQSTAHFADWEGLRPFLRGGDHLASLCTAGRGLIALFFPQPRGRTAVVTYVRSDRAAIEGDAARFYAAQLERLPDARQRLEGATRVGPVVGLRRIANRHREPVGPGWALVGDALHHKDPIDGQGVYDALMASRLLDRHADAPARYREEVLAATTPMLRATAGRVKRELFDEPPTWVIRTLIRWTLTDPTYQRRFSDFLTRQEDPRRWPPPSLLGAAALRGIARDLRGFASGDVRR